MFGFFKKRPKMPAEKDIYWITMAAKNDGIAELIRNATGPVVVSSFFSEDLREIETYLKSKSALAGKAISYSEAYRIVAPFTDGTTETLLIVAGHHFLKAHDDQVREWVMTRENTTLVFCSALEEPLFSLFGGERIISLMRKLGLDESESVSHSMISTSIQNAQAKIARKVEFENRAQSARQWAEMNHLADLS